MRVMITGGGTGGHTSPAVAVIEELRERDPRLAVQWVGRKGGVEQRVCEAQDIPFRAVPVEGWPRGSNLRKPWVAAKLALGMARSWRHIRRFHPQVVLGVGGYVSLPLMWVAQRMKIPTALHEQNRLLGMANRMLAPRAGRVFLSFSNTAGAFPKEKALVVGNPVRTGFYDPPNQRTARERLGLDDLPTVFVCGGSQGARRLNDAMMDALGRFETGEVQFFWMTGRHDVERARKAAAEAPVRVEVRSFVDDMVGACSAADLVVSRAGASSTAELATLHKPAVLVPFPHATDNHQEQNAKAFEEVGAAILLRDEECTGERLAGMVRELLADSARRIGMADAAGSLARPGAAETIVEELFRLVFGETKEPRS